MSVARLPQFFPERVNMRTPNQSIADHTTLFNGLIYMRLGAPAALDADGILDDALMVNGSAVTKTTFLTRELPGTYGRVVTAVASSTNTRAMTVYGKDYKGAKMIETITLTSATAVSGKKAFKWIDQIVFASASDTTTVDVGWGDVLGLPFKVVAPVTEFINGVANPQSFEKFLIPCNIPATELSAGTSIYAVSPVRGYVTALRTVVTTAIVTGGAVTVKIGGVAVAGLSVTVADSDAVGTVGSSTVAFGLATGLVAANGAIEVVPASAFNGGGALNAHLEITPAEIIPGDATTATATTGDVRGTYRPATATNGTNEYGVLAFVDTTQMDGIAQYSG